jgi:hypothetical protein
MSEEEQWEKISIDRKKIVIHCEGLFRKIRTTAAQVTGTAER